MCRHFVKYLILISVYLILRGSCTESKVRIKRYGFLSPYDPEYHKKLEIQRVNLRRIDDALEELRRNSHKYGFRYALSITSKINNIDLTREDALDAIPYFTKNSLYRYRVNKEAVSSVKRGIKSKRNMCTAIYEAAVDSFMKEKAKLLDIVGKSWRRSYIVRASDDKDRVPITFS